MIELSLLGAVTAFAAGIISFLSPCVLPLVPGYISYIGGSALGQVGNQRSLSQTLAIVAL